MKMTGSWTVVLLFIVTIVMNALTPWSCMAGPVDPDDVRILLDRISEFEIRAEDASSRDELRSKALNDALESRAALLKLEEVQADPRRPVWQADQAEALLLKRIEFPSSWSTHLMVAHPSCPLLPADIPLVVARGLQEILRAEGSISQALESLEAREGYEQDATLLSLHERLKFERDLRIPLLKAIALLLAGRADPASSQEAFEILLSMHASKDLPETTQEVIGHWFRQAALANGNEDAIRELSTATNPATTRDGLERLREVALLEDPTKARALGQEMIRKLDRERSYEKLLLTDVMERLSTKTDADQIDVDRRGWEDGAGDTWLMLLDDAEREGNWTLDGPLATRLAALERLRGSEGAPLAVLWAKGREELARRSRDRIENPEMLDTLRTNVMDATMKEPGRARTLETAARIAMLEDERLIAAELCEILYRDHPRHPFGGPELVADLTEPWARAGHDDASRRYERALQNLIDRNADGTGGDEIEAQVLRLAEHHLRRGMPKKSRGLLNQFRPRDRDQAARFLEACLQEIVQLRELDTLSNQRLDVEFDLLLERVDRVLGEFGPTDVAIQTAASRARLASLAGRERLPNDIRSIRMVERIIDRSDIPDELRIEALFLRHSMKLARISERSDALENMPCLRKAIEIDTELAARNLVDAVERGLLRLKKSRQNGSSETIRDEMIEELTALAGLIDQKIRTSLSIPERIMLGRCFNELGPAPRAISHWEALAAGQPDAWIIMQGHADALALSSKGPDLAEAMRLYLRLGQGAPGENVPEDVWWNAQLGQLLMMEKAERSMERIPTRIQRLRLIDPDLGGTTVRTKFESLLRRTAQKS
tara:strand:- start:859 stop:3360 length:2502 start_codon:yes stop_codon:yes gene_type:complete